MTSSLVEASALDATAAARTPSPLELEDPSSYAHRLLLRPRSGSGWPASLVLGRTLARGSNSTVHRAALIPVPPSTRMTPAASKRGGRRRGGGRGAVANDIGTERGWRDVVDESLREAAVRLARHHGAVVVRVPRHASDTRMASHAMWEFQTTAIAARHGVAPALYDAFFAKHTTAAQRRGLHLMTRWYPMDLRTALLRYYDDWDDAVIEALGRCLAAHVAQMARLGIFHFDLKPQNIVVDADAGGVRDARILDFGKEFCQRRGTDHMSLLQRIDKVIEAERWGGPSRANADAVAELTMLVILSCTLGHELFDARTDFKTLDADARAALNPLRHIVRDKWDAAPPVLLRCVRELLRDDDVRDLLRHYCGARNACTKRVFRFAGVPERKTQHQKI